MLFDWDDANTKHIWERHRLLPEQVEAAMRIRRRRYAIQIVNDETRTLYVAGSAASGVLLVVTTQRAHRTRVVTAHPASRKQRIFFWGKNEAEIEPSSEI